MKNKMKRKLITNNEENKMNIDEESNEILKNNNEINSKIKKKRWNVEGWNNM